MNERIPLKTKNCIFYTVCKLYNYFEASVFLPWQLLCQGKNGAVFFHRLTENIPYTFLPGDPTDTFTRGPYRYIL